MKRGNKNSQAKILTSVLIIIGVMFAVVIVYSVVRPLVSEKSEDIESSYEKLQLMNALSIVSWTEESPGIVKITVRADASSDYINSLTFEISSNTASCTETKEIIPALGPLESREIIVGTTCTDITDVIILDFAIQEEGMESSSVIDSCTQLNQADSVYYLDRDLNGNEVTANCMQFTAKNIILDCQGHSIINWNLKAAIIDTNWRSGLTIKNCVIEGYLGYGYDGIRAFGSDNIIKNNIISHVGNGINVYGLRNIVEENTVENTIKAISLRDNNNIVRNNFVGNNVIAQGWGLSSWKGENNQFINNEVYGNNYGIVLYASSNSVLNCNMFYDNSKSDAYVYSDNWYNFVDKNNNISYYGDSLISQHIGEGAEFINKGECEDIGGSSIDCTKYVKAVGGATSGFCDTEEEACTLDYVKNTKAEAGDVVCLLPGEYGSVSFNSARVGSSGNYITYVSDPASPDYSAKFSHIGFTTGRDYYIKIKGFEVYAPSPARNGIEVQGTDLVNVKYVEIDDCKVHGNPGSTHTSDGPSDACIYVRKSSNILVENCEAYYSGGTDGDGIIVYGGGNVIVRSNKVHHVLSTGINFGGNGPYLAENNIIYEARPEWSPPYPNDAHGSGITVRAPNTILRGNTIYNFGCTRPIRWYQDETYGDGSADYGYNNCLVENNLIYETSDFTGTMWWFEVVDAGTNFTIRNNTFLKGAKIYFAKKVDGSGLTLQNNVFNTLSVDNWGTYYTDCTLCGGYTDCICSSMLKAQTCAEARSKWDNVNEENNLVGSQFVATGGGYQCTYNDFSATSNSLSSQSLSPSFVDYQNYNYYPDPDGKLCDGSLFGTPVGTVAAGALPCSGGVVPTTCTDGTARNSCSLTKPKYCNSNLVLIDNCGLCECSSGICKTDGSCGCANGDTQDCGTNIGECEYGIQTCDTSGNWGACIGGINPGDNPETCDGKDNDCNGIIDDGNLCPVGEGCVGGTCQEVSFPTGYVAFYKFNNLNDESGINNIGALLNGATISNGVLNLDGVNDYASIPHSSSLNVDYITLSSWVYVTQYTDDQRIVSKEFGDTDPYSIYTLLLSGTGEKYPSLRLGIGGARKSVTSTSEVPLNQWIHVVGTYDGATMKIYLNGNLVGSTSQTGVIQDNTEPLYLGDSQFYSPRFFNGKIDNVMIYNRSLSASEISQVFSLGRV